MRPAFAHRRCDEPLWRHLAQQTISAENLLQLLYIWRCQYSVIRVDMIVLPRWQRLAAVSTTQTVEHSVLSTDMSVETLVLVKQGYLSSFNVNFIPNELGHGGVLSVWTQSGQHCAYGFLTCRRTQVFDSLLFDLTQMGVALVRWMEFFRFIIQHVHIRWVDYKVLPETGHRSLYCQSTNYLH